MFTPEDRPRDFLRLSERPVSSAPALVPQEKDPGLAFLMSLLLPGLGQLYCGKRSRAVWTLVFFAAGLAAFIFGWKLSEGGTKGSELLLGTGLRTALVLYVFAFLDAYYTARELSDGTDSRMVYNPRVAAVLNLLTRGFGYWYVDERGKGIVIFFLIGLAAQGASHLQNQTYAALIEVAIEIALAVLAADAYRIAKRENELHQQKFANVYAPAAVLTPSSGLQPHLPLALAGLFVAGYAGLAALGILIPDYTTIDQSQAQVRKLEDRISYSNPKYDVEMQIPPTWQFTKAQPEYFAAAEHPEAACSALFLAAPRWPWTTLESLGDSLVSSQQGDQPGGAGIEHRSSRLGNLPAVEILFRSPSDIDLGDETITIDRQEHYVLAAKGLSVYALLFFYEEPCTADVEFIRQNVTIGN